MTEDLNEMMPNRECNECGSGLLVAYSLIVKRDKEEQQQVILLSVYNGGHDCLQVWVSSDVLDGCLQHPEFSCDYGEYWQQWRGFCCIGTIQSKAEHTLLLRGVRKLSDAACDEVLLKVGPYSLEHNACCVNICMPTVSEQRKSRCCYLYYDDSFNRHCYLV